MQAVAELQCEKRTGELKDARTVSVKYKKTTPNLLKNLNV